MSFSTGSQPVRQDSLSFNGLFWRCVVCTKSLSRQSVLLKNGKGKCGIFEEPFALKRALGRIFKYLAVKPDEEGTNVTALSEEWRNKPFCPKCFDLVDSVAKFHVKILELELLIQEKVEVLGSVLRHSVSHVKHTNSSSSSRSSCVTGLQKFDPWTKVRKSVACKYDCGMFPSPRVTLEELVKKSAGDVKVEVSQEEDSQETLVKGTFKDDAHFDGGDHFDIEGPDVSDMDLNQHGMALLAEIQLPIQSITTTENPDVVNKSSVIECTSQDVNNAAVQGSKEKKKNATGASKKHTTKKPAAEIVIPKTCSCPKPGCEFVEPVVLSVKSTRTGVTREKDSVIFTRRKILCHYLNVHLTVKKDDIKGSAKEGFYYSCHLCDYRAPVKSTSLVHKTTYPPRLHLSRHYIAEHEGGWKADERIPRAGHFNRFIEQPESEDLESQDVKLKRKRKCCPESESQKEMPTITFSPGKLYDTTNFGCPLCPFKPDFDDSWKGAKRTVMRAKAMNDLYDHYFHHHLPIQYNDFKLHDQTGENFYLCTLCDFQQPIKIRTGKNQARRNFIPHYLKVHHEGSDDMQQPTKKVKEKPKGPIVTIPCPEEDCSHTVSYVNAGNALQRAKRKRATLLNLCRHCIAVHDYPEKASFNSPRRCRNKCIEVVDGHDVFKCYRCNLILKVDYSEDCGDSRTTKEVARLATYNKFLTHYIPHVVPKVEGKGSIVPYRPMGFVEDKSAPRATIHCQHCSFVIRKKNLNTHGDRSLGKTLMRNHVRRHYKLEHPGVTVPNFRYYRLKKNLIQYNQEDVAVNDEDDDTDGEGEEGDFEYPSDIELQPEVELQVGYAKDALTNTNETEGEENKVCVTDDEESEEEVEMKYNPNSGSDFGVDAESGEEPSDFE